jgi:hypothetical protein
MGMCEGSQAFGRLSKAFEAGEFRQAGLDSLCVDHGLFPVGVSVRRGPSLVLSNISEDIDTSIRISRVFAVRRKSSLDSAFFAEATLPVGLRSAVSQLHRAIPQALSFASRGRAIPETLTKAWQRLRISA